MQDDLVELHKLSMKPGALTYHEQARMIYLRDSNTSLREFKDETEKQQYIKELLAKLNA